MSKTKKISKASPKKVSLKPSFSKKEKIKRKRYLEVRINELFNNISEWINGTDYSIKKSKVPVDEILLPGAEIYSGDKLIVSLKPAGLWGFGVNCRIDIVSKKEPAILLDIAEETASPQWELVPSIPHKQIKMLTKMIFRNLLKRNNIEPKKNTAKLRLIVTQ